MMELKTIPKDVYSRSMTDHFGKRRRHNATADVVREYGLCFMC